MILWLSQVPDFFLEKHPIISPISISLPPMNTFEISFIFCKTRQNWNIPQTSNNSMHIISFFLSRKVVFFLGQNLIGKPRFVINLKASYYSSHLQSFKASHPKKIDNPKYTIFAMLCQKNLSAGKDFSISLSVLSIMPIKHHPLLQRGNRAQCSQLKQIQSVCSWP